MGNLVKFLLVVIALLVVGLLYNSVRLDKYKSEFYKYKNNYDVIKYHYGKMQAKLNDREIYITQRDLHLMYSNLLQRIKEYGIKEKHIDNIISYTYRVKDTSIVIEVYDTIKDLRSFVVNKDCYYLSIDVLKDTAKVNVDIKDTFDVILYRKVNKDVSWIKRLFNKKLKYYHHVLIYSNCKNDTIMSTTNVKIVE